jgi:hypothetical protein
MKSVLFWTVYSKESVAAWGTEALFFERKTREGVDNSYILLPLYSYVSHVIYVRDSAGYRGLG